MSDPISRLNATLEGRYHVERELGRGGMATVYLADDLRHGRKVALKVLRPELAAVIGAERFLAEIKTTANLQHPHILPLHDSGAADGLLYYVMPYVEGESLRQRLDRERQLPVDEAVDIATHVAEALDYAHHKGVVHRDIKPANVLMTEGGAVVTDFGIALALGAAGGERLTETGLSLGTPHYMSPEQATGDQPVGPATDVYALGCVLYEMLVGEPPFTGSTAQAVLGKIVMGAADRVGSHRRSVPANVEATVARSLEEVPADRFKSAADLARALTDPRFGRDTDRAGGPSARGGRRRIVLAVGALAIALLAFWAGARSRPRATPGTRNEPVRLAIPLPADQRPYVYFNEAPMDISPDGRLLAYVATSRGTSRLYLRPLAELTPRPVAGTEGARVPFFSPDGRSIGYFANGKLWRVALDGGAPLPICDVGSARFGATWGPDGTIYFGDDTGLLSVAADGGTPKIVSALDTARGDDIRGLPQVLPDGRVLLSVGTSTGAHAELLDPATGQSRVVLDAAGGARFVPPGFLVYGGTGVAQVVAFDPASDEVTSSAASLPDDIQMGNGDNPFMAVSDDGTLVYLPGGSPMETVLGRRVGYSADLVRVGRDGRETVLWEDWPGHGSMRLSPDGRRAVDFVPNDPKDLANGNYRIWAFDLERHTSTRLTSTATSIYPLWAPDGDRVAFSSTLSGRMSLFSEPSDGTAEPHPLLVGKNEQYASSWSRDGRYLAYFERSPTTGLDIWVLSMEGDREARPFVRTDDDESWPAFSPDGRWLAYSSDASGRGEVYVRPFPGPGERTLVSNAGGSLPKWSANGDELFYRQGDGLWVVTVRTDPTLTVGSPERLFRGDYEEGYAVDPLGKGFIMLRRGSHERPSQFNVVQNWRTELERLVPAER